jgi:hypothetical protein
MATVFAFAPGVPLFDPPLPQPAAATAIRTAATAAAPLRLHDLDTLSPEELAVRW